MSRPAQCHALSVAGDSKREPLPSNRGVVPFDAFCRSTGLDHAAVEHLMRTELLEVSVWKDEELTRPFGIFDDALPSRQVLKTLRLPLRRLRP